jgi:hypothetical protein
MQFLPENLGGWVSLTVQFVAAATTAIVFSTRLIRGPLERALAIEAERTERGFKEQGGRLGALEAGCSSNAARVEAVDRASERLHLQMTSMAEHHGRLEERLGALATTLQIYHDQRVQEDRMIGERLARIESKMDIPHRGGG